MGRFQLKLIYLFFHRLSIKQLFIKIQLITELNIYETIRPIIVYTTETWALDLNDEWILKTFKSKIIRQVCRLFDKKLHRRRVIALALSIAILVIILLYNSNFRVIQFYAINLIIILNTVNIVILLTRIEVRPVQDPYIFIGNVLTTLYFSCYLLNLIVIKI